MTEYNNSNPFKYYVSFGSDFKVANLISTLKAKHNLTGKFHINDVSIIFEVEDKSK